MGEEPTDTPVPEPTDADCGRAIAVRLTAFSVDQHTAEANSSIVIGP